MEIGGSDVLQTVLRSLSSDGFGMVACILDMGETKIDSALLLNEVTSTLTWETKLLQFLFFWLLVG